LKRLIRYSVACEGTEIEAAHPLQCSMHAREQRLKRLIRCSVACEGTEIEAAHPKPPRAQGTPTVHGHAMELLVTADDVNHRARKSQRKLFMKVCDPQYGVTKAHVFTNIGTRGSWECTAVDKSIKVEYSDAFGKPRITITHKSGGCERASPKLIRYAIKLAARKRLL